MKKVLLDTDTLSYFFRGNPLVLSHMDEYASSFDNVSISVITYYEILNGLLYKDARKQLAVFKEFIKFNEIIDLSVPIADVAATLYANARSEGLAAGHNDTLIAATAIVYDLQLVTNNENHFKHFDKLDFTNWNK